MQTVQEIFTKSIYPLGKDEKLKLASMILNDIAEVRSRAGNNGENDTGTVRELFGTVSLGHPTGADNESIDRDLAIEYGSRHEDE